MGKFQDAYSLMNALCMHTHDVMNALCMRTHDVTNALNVLTLLLISLFISSFSAFRNACALTT